MGELRNIRCRLVAADGAYQYQTMDFFRRDWAIPITASKPATLVTEKDLPDHARRIRTRRYQFKRWEGRTAVFHEVVE